MKSFNICRKHHKVLIIVEQDNLASFYIESIEQTRRIQEFLLSSYFFKKYNRRDKRIETLVVVVLLLLSLSATE